MAKIIQNKKAFFDYEILEKFEAGLGLKGYEVKALKNGRGSIMGARVLIRGGEAFVVGMDIAPYQPGNAPAGYDSGRTRRLLLHKKEIRYLEGKANERGLTLVPISVYTKGNLIKLEFGAGRGKKKSDKRETIKKREAQRKIERALKF
ncbi:MAG: SsrA-binding protein SmpB [Candidatus Niyogibacteria bacterium]|nr:SsrA-binding protein SmpB [Candidatus Niyogibacteria bacterium]